MDWEFGLADADYYIYRMDKQQGPPERHRDYTQYPVINRGGTEDEQNVYKTESLFCAAEINTTL